MRRSPEPTRWRRRVAACAAAVAAASVPACGYGMPDAPDAASAAARPTIATWASTTTTRPNVAPTAPTTSQASIAPSAAPPSGGAGGEFAFVIEPVGDEVKARLGTTYKSGCPVPLADLRAITTRYWGTDGAPHTGEVVVHRDVAESLRPVFAKLYELKYPIEQLGLFNGVGTPPPNLSIAFNCRKKVGNSGSWSAHSYGRAIDLNPVLNPYIGSDRKPVPPQGAPYADRATASGPGVLKDGDPVVTVFEANGWKWGGHWNSPKDYMHFSTDGQ